jgi:thiol-disulfide isomerase/thioredoxin
MHIGMNEPAITIGHIPVPTELVVLLVSAMVAAVVRRYVGRRQNTKDVKSMDDGSLATSRGPILAALLAGTLTWTVSTVILRLSEGPSLSSLNELPFFTLQDEPVKLSSLAIGKPSVVNLWATWCPPCRSEMPVLAAAQLNFPGVNFVFANQGEYGPTVQRYLAATELNLANVLLDPGKKLGQQLGSMALPTTVFLDASGRLVDTQIGALTSESLAGKLAKLQVPSAPRNSAVAP